MEELVVNTKGDIVAKYANGKFEKGDVRAFDLKLKEELYKIEKGRGEQRTKI